MNSFWIICNKPTMIRFQLLSIEHNLLVVVFSKCLGMKFKLNVWDKNSNAKLYVSYFLKPNGISFLKYLLIMTTKILKIQFCITAQTQTYSSCVSCLSWCQVYIIYHGISSCITTEAYTVNNINNKIHIIIYWKGYEN